MNQKLLQIDQDGYPMFAGVRVADANYGRELLSQMFVRDYVTYTKSGDEEIVVEAFDAPLIVVSVHKGEGTTWKFQMPYDYVLSFDLSNLKLDNFDRFCGHFDNGVSFVMNRPAQGSFFGLLDDYSDTSITVAGKEIEVENKYTNTEAASKKEFWSNLYETNETPWDLDEATPVLKQALLQIKLPRQRVAVLGAGRGHDAVELARVGHMATAFDFSEAAQKEFQQKYESVRDLNYIVADVFKIPQEYHQQFDLVFDHTFFVAIDPQKRKEVVQAWKKLLVPGGHVLGIFFVMDKDLGPPYGSSEWELLELFRKDFDLIYWTRTKASVERRKYKELLVYASKKV